MKNETVNLYNSQVNKLSKLIDNLWESDNKVSDLEKERYPWGGSAAFAPTPWEQEKSVSRRIHEEERQSAA